MGPRSTNRNPEFPQSWDYSIHLPEAQKETKSILMKDFYHFCIKDTGITLLEDCLSLSLQFYVGIDETHIRPVFLLSCLRVRGGRSAPSDTHGTAGAEVTARRCGCQLRC